MPRSSRSAFLCIVVLLAGQAIAQQPPALEKGFRSGRHYDLGEIDSVNTLNSNLGLHIPIGPASYPVNGSLSMNLQLTFSSKAWDYEDFLGYNRAVMSRRSTAGAGWLFSLGRLIPPHSSTNPSSGWLYESSDAAEHAFADKLHHSDPATILSGDVKGVGYARDGSYLRMLRRDTNEDNTVDTIEVEWPDGIVRTFEPGTGYLTGVRDRFGNTITVTHLPVATGTPCTATESFAAAWKITDSQNARINYVCFRNMPLYESIGPGHVERIVLAAPPHPTTGAARTATYVFNYTFATISRGCHSTFPESPTLDNVPLLSSITLPDASTFSFTYYDSNTPNCQSGAVSSVVVPTGARFDYTYRTFLTSSDQCPNGMFMTPVTGVATRTVSGPRIPTAVWTYASETNDSVDVMTPCEEGDLTILRPAPADQFISRVTDPLGNVTENYYSTWPLHSAQLYDANGQVIRDGSGNPITGTSVNGTRLVEFGLPYTRLASNGNRLLSQRVYTSTGFAANPKTPTRSSFVIYDRDDLPCAEFAPYCFNSNPRLSSERIIYHDDADRVADTDLSDFDGVGHYRQVSLGGTFAGGNNQSYTGYNTRDPDVNPNSGLSTGTYPGSFSPPTLADSWVLMTAPKVTITEAGQTAITQACYEPSTGFLKAARVLKGSTRHGTDLLSTFGRDAGGNLTSQTFYGGDVQANAPTSGTLCATADSAPEEHDYKLLHTYQWGIRKTSKYDGASFFTLNRTIDQATGLVRSETDSAGHTTLFAYDDSFRLESVSPPGLAKTTYSYTLPSGSGASAIPARVEEATASTQGHGTAEKHYQYDALGRIWRQKTKLPGNTWSVIETRHNGLGWPVWISKPETLVTPAPTTGNPNPTEYDFVPGFKTLYNSYDPFGRPASITAPDGHLTTFTYAGASSTRRTATIAGNSELEVPASTKETYDRQQRLVSVTEADATPEAVTTSYSYDVGGRLATVSMPGEGGTQTRTFSYDNRGMLDFEEHAELGINGYGRTTYGPYDARGNARRRITGTTNGAFDLTFAFDSAERVTSITQTGTGNTIALFAYDDPTGTTYPQCTGNRCNGRLAAAARFNLFDDLGAIAVTESYQYDGLGGTISRRDMAVGSSASFEGQNFLMTQAHNDLGRIDSISYPCRKTETGSCNGTPRTVSNGYTNGFLTAVTGFASSISYQPNGLPGTVLHANGVADTLTPSQYGMMRPCSMLTYRGTLVTNGSDPCGVTASADASLSWSTGEYQYDGAGNIKKIGLTRYVYDAFSRLRGWTRSWPAGGYDSTSVALDAFGNHLFETVRGCGPLVNGQANCYSTGVLARQLTGTTNHYADTTYDDAGNVTADNQRQFTYDPLNMTRTVSTSGREFRYLYGPDEERIALVERVPVSGITRNRTTWTLRGFNSELLSSWTDDSTSGTRVWTWKEDEIWRGGAVLASVTPTRTMHYSLDHLGSPRVITDAAGQLLGYQDFTPYGSGGTSDGGFLQFTGQERDAAIVGGIANLPDHFHARQYDRGGRFLSVDPIINPDSPQSPQLWNRYAYAANNPLKYVDPTGQIIDLSGLTAQERNDLLLSLNAFTGNEYGVNNNGELTLIKTNPGASATATAFLNDAISSKTTYSVTADNKSDAIFAEANTSTNVMKFDFADFSDIQYNGVDARALGLGSIFVHELAHLHPQPKGQTLTDPPSGFEATQLGPNEHFVNRIRMERSLPTRSPVYEGQRGGWLGWRVKVNFQNVFSTKPNKVVYVSAREYNRP